MSKITLRHIRIFEAVCESGCNITKASERLHMTQPAVSLAISELESYYNVRLFDRISRRLYLSETGSRFLEYARTILLSFDDLEKSIREFDNVIRVGASVSIGSMLMPELVSEYKAANPATTVRVKVDRSDKLENAAIGNELDFILMEGIVHFENLISEDFMEDSLAVIGKPELFSGCSPVSPEEFLRLDFLLRENGSGTREVFDSTLTSLGYAPPEPVWESLSTAALMNAACAGLGVAVVPKRMAAAQLESGAVCEIRVDGITFSRKYKIVRHKDKKLSAAALSFIELCRKNGGLQV